MDVDFGGITTLEGLHCHDGINPPGVEASHGFEVDHVDAYDDALSERSEDRLNGYAQSSSGSRSVDSYSDSDDYPDGDTIVSTVVGVDIDYIYDQFEHLYEHVKPEVDLNRDTILTNGLILYYLKNRYQMLEFRSTQVIDSKIKSLFKYISGTNALIFSNGKVEKLDYELFFQFLKTINTNQEVKPASFKSLMRAFLNEIPLTEKKMTNTRKNCGSQSTDAYHRYLKLKMAMVTQIMKMQSGARSDLLDQLIAEVDVIRVEPRRKKKRYQESDRQTLMNLIFNLYNPIQLMKKLDAIGEGDVVTDEMFYDYQMEIAFLLTHVFPLRNGSVEVLDMNAIADSLKNADMKKKFRIDSDDLEEVDRCFVVLEHKDPKNHKKRTRAGGSGVYKRVYPIWVLRLILNFFIKARAGICGGLTSPVIFVHCNDGSFKGFKNILSKKVSEYMRKKFGFFDIIDDVARGQSVKLSFNQRREIINMYLLPTSNQARTFYDERLNQSKNHDSGEEKVVQEHNRNIREKFYKNDDSRYDLLMELRDYFRVLSRHTDNELKTGSWYKFYIEPYLVGLDRLLDDSNSKTKKTKF